MSDAIPFDRSFAFEYGRADWLTPRVRRIVCRNPGPFTFVGTNTYIVGVGDVAVIDPGPDDPAHLNALMSALSGERVTHIIVTHTHKDHSPLAQRLKAHTGAPLLGEGPHRPARANGNGGINTMDASSDHSFVPDQVLRDGDVIAGTGWHLETVATPGHCANHLCFALAEDAALFSGDHVMAWSTSIVAPPDGSMNDYMASLRKLVARSEELYWPAHGGQITNGRAFAAGFIKHRLQREAAILDKLRQHGPLALPRLVDMVYAGLEPQLKPAAALSSLAHLESLIERGLATATPQATLDGMFAASEQG